MSTLLDRYLNAVEEALPRDVAKADIVAEIRDELQSQIDEGADEIEVIKAYGHPRVVAARYGRVQYVIGPDLFPFYWLTMRNVLIGGIALVLAGGGLVAVLANNGKIFFDALDIAWHTALWIAAVVTIIFAVAEQVPERGSARIGPFSRDWDPARLPLPGTLPPVKSFAALVEFVANFLMLLVLLDVRSQHIPLDALVANILSAGNAALTPAWYPAYYATIARQRDRCRFGHDGLSQAESHDRARAFANVRKRRDDRGNRRHACERPADRRSEQRMEYLGAMLSRRGNRRLARQRRDVTARDPPRAPTGVAARPFP